MQNIIQEDPHKGHIDPHLYGSSLFITEEFDTLPEAPIAPGMVDKWRENDRTLAFQFNPASNDGFAWITPTDYKHELERDGGVPIQKEDTKLYPASIPGLKYTPEYTGFVTECFMHLQRMVNANISMNSGGLDFRRDMRWNDQISDYISEFLQLIDACSDTNQRLRDVGHIVRCFNAIRFQPDTRNNVASLFSEWVNWADENPTSELVEQVMAQENPEQDSRFWLLLYIATVRNVIDLCAAMLSSIKDHYTGNNSKHMIDYAIQLMTEYPKDCNTFVFSEWKKNVEEMKRSLELVEDARLQSRLELLCSILLGNKETIFQVSSTWYEAMCGLLCYADPTRKRLDEYYVLSVERYPVDQTVAWEEGCSAVIQGDFLIAIEKIESLDPFVATVISETCEAKGLMDIYLGDSFTNIRNWLLINFAKLCLDERALALSGVKLLVQINTSEAKAIFAEYVPRLVLVQPEDVEELINTAMDLGLDETVKIIHRTTAKQLEMEGAYLESMIHLEQIQDRNALRTLSWKLFEECLVRGEPLSDFMLADAVENRQTIDIAPAVRESLAPYAVLAKAFIYLREGSSIKAANHFIALFRFPHIPVKYYCVLFMSMDLLLQRQQPRVFSVVELTDVMRAIDKWEEAVQKDERTRQEIRELMKLISRTSANDDESTKEMEIQHILKNTRQKLAKEVSRAYMESA